MVTRPRRKAQASASPPSTVAALAVSPHGLFHLDPHAPDAAELPARRLAAFAVSSAHGLLHLASDELGAALPPSLAFGRELAKLFFARLCAIPDLEATRAHLAIPPPADELAALADAAPPMLGAEYLSAQVLAEAWSAIEAEAQRQIDAFTGPVEQYLHEKSPLWNAVGRVHFHLAENKGDARAPFAFLATYATKLSKAARVQHAPLGRAIEEYAGAADKGMLLRLLQPVQRAAEKSAFLKELVASGEIFHPLAWTPREAYAFLQDIPAFEESGVLVRVP